MSRYKTTTHLKYIILYLITTIVEFILPKQYEDFRSIKPRRPR